MNNIIKIGAAADCDVRLQDSSVSRRHALLFCIGGSFHLKDIHSTNGTFLNGQRLTLQPTEIPSVPGHPTADRVRFGNYEMTVTELLQRAQRNDLQTLLIGRDAHNDIALQDQSISAFHARITVRNGQLYIADLWSTNGVYLNGRQIQSETTIRAGDDVKIGTVPLPWDHTLIQQIVQQEVDVSDSNLSSGSDRSQPVKTTVSGESATSEIPEMASGYIPVLFIGRNPSCDVVLPSNFVSAKHAKLTFRDGRYLLEDMHSTNGTQVNGEPIRSREIHPGDTITFGNDKVLSFDELIAYLKTDRTPASDRRIERIRLTKEVITAGRDSDNDIVLDYPQISRRHAHIIQRQGRTFIRDLNSTNGTFVNGERIKEVEITTDDIVHLGPYELSIVADGIIEKKSILGEMRLEINDVVRRYSRLVLDHVSFVISPGELVGLIGGSGAGKSTLLRIANGNEPPNSGKVSISGYDLYRNYDRFRGNIGYVPQDDIVHNELTVYESLIYSARLRMPDYTSDQIRQRVEEVLAQLEIDGIRDNIVGKEISGGQRKRVNVAHELLTEPSLIFLDEPTSGLDPYSDNNVMTILRKLADQGKTVILTTHNINRRNFEKLDRVAVLAVNGGLENGSRFAYYGPALPESIDFFGVEHPEEIFDFIQPEQGKTTNRLIQKFDGSPEEEKYVRRQFTSSQQTNGDPPKQKLKRRFGFKQWWVLTARYLKIKIKDSTNTGILLAQAPIIAILLVLAYYGYVGAEGSDNPFWITGPLFVLSVAAIWFGSSNAAKEIIGEKAIYERERMINLKIPSYIFSKVAVLSGLAIIQCGLMLIIIHPLLELKGSMGDMFITLSLTAIVASIQGLLISTMVKRTDQALALVPISLIPQVVLSGLIIPLTKLGGVRWIADLMLSRWSYEAMADINNFEYTKNIFNPETMREEPVTRSLIDILNGNSFFQDVGNGATGFGADMFRLDWLVLGGFAVVMLIAMIVILKSRDKV